MTTDSEFFVDDPWLAQVRIGAAAEEFLHSPLGKLIQERSNREIQQATLELVEAAWDDEEANKQLRVRINRAADAVQWLLEAINDADQARQAIDEQEAEATEP